MPFWRRESKVVMSLRSISTINKQVTFLTIILSCLGYWGIFFYGPELAIRLKKSREFAVLHKKDCAIKAKIAQKQALIEKRERLAQQISQYSLSVGSYQQTVGKLIQVMRLRGMSCRELKPLYVKRQQYYEKHFVVLSCKGVFHEVLSFLQEVEDPRYPVTIKHMHLRKGRESILFLDAVVRVVSFKDIKP